MDYSIGLSGSGDYILVVPKRPADTEAEVNRRWTLVAELGRNEHIYKVLFDHRRCAPAPSMDLISAALRHREWREGERWRIAVLLSAQLPNVARLQLEAVAEFVSALQQEAEVFWDIDKAEEWLMHGPALG